jgi:hypothetical protein
MSNKCLLLNADYQALGIISVPKAFLLIWKGSAEMVEQDGAQVLHSQYQFFPKPSVVRIKQYLDIRGRQRRSSSKRNRILARDGYKCMYCGRHGDDRTLTVDHIIPASKGGERTPENLVACCFPCNQRKGNRTLFESGMELRKHPAALTFGIDRQILSHEAQNHKEWMDYLYLS